MKFDYTKSKIKYLTLIVALYVFVLQNFIELNYFEAFSYADEIFAIGFFLVFIIKILTKKRIDKFESISITCFIIIIFMATISTMLHSFQPISNEILDLFANLKFVLTLLGAIELYREFDLSRYINKIYIHVRFIAIIFFVLTIIDIVFDLFPDSNYQFYKYGLKSLRLFYGHPATLSVVCLLLVSVLVYLDGYGINSKLYKLILIIIMILTFRAKIVGTLAIMSMIYIYVIKFKSKITIPRLLMLSPFTVILAWGEIQSYYVTNIQASRLLLTITSFKIAKDMFPLGSGFATFGSAFSIDPYSIVYSTYNLSGIWGISMDASQDISDTFWPMILGQFGVIALVAYIYFVYKIFKQIQKVRTKNINIYLAGWCLFSYLIIASTSESAFVNAYAVFYAIYLSVFLKTFKGEQL